MLANLRSGCRSMAKEGKIRIKSGCFSNKISVAAHQMSKFKVKFQREGSSIACKFSLNFPKG